MLTSALSISWIWITKKNKRRHERDEREREACPTHLTTIKCRRWAAHIFRLQCRPDFLHLDMKTQGKSAGRRIRKQAKQNRQKQITITQAGHNTALHISGVVFQKERAAKLKVNEWKMKPTQIWINPPAQTKTEWNRKETKQSNASFIQVSSFGCSWLSSFEELLLSFSWNHDDTKKKSFAESHYSRRFRVRFLSHWFSWLRLLFHCLWVLLFVLFLLFVRTTSSKCSIEKPHWWINIFTENTLLNTKYVYILSLTFFSLILSPVSLLGAAAQILAPKKFRLRKKLWRFK